MILQRSIITLVGWIVLAPNLPSARAQLPSVSDSRLGVDALRLNNRRRLYGFAIGRVEEGGQRKLKFAVERKWLENTYPSLYRATGDDERSIQKKASELFQSRVEQWIEDRKDEVGFANMLRLELQEFEQQTSKDQSEKVDRQFCVLVFTTDEIRELRMADTSARKVAGIAYMQGLEDVAITPASILRKRLEALEVDLKQITVDLTQQLPRVEESSSKQWAAKKALYEYQYREPLEYQGTGSMLLRKSQEQADIGQLLQSLLSSDGLGGLGGMNSITLLGAELGLPEFKALEEKKSNSDWARKITKEAEEEGIRGLVAYRLNQSALSSKVTVETHFLAMEAPGDWFTVFKHSTAVDANQKTEDMQNRMQRIENDPQIAQLTKTFSALGVDLGTQLEKALMHGAATEKALEMAKQAFTAFANKYGDEVAGPSVPLVLSKK